MMTAVAFGLALSSATQLCVPGVPVGLSELILVCGIIVHILMGAVQGSNAPARFVPVMVLYVLATVPGFAVTLTTLGQTPCAVYGLLAYGWITLLLAYLHYGFDYGRQPLDRLAMMFVILSTVYFCVVLALAWFDPAAVDGFLVKSDSYVFAIIALLGVAVTMEIFYRPAYVLGLLIVVRGGGAEGRRRDTGDRQRGRTETHAGGAADQRQRRRSGPALNRAWYGGLVAVRRAVRDVWVAQQRDRVLNLRGAHRCGTVSRLRRGAMVEGAVVGPGDAARRHRGADVVPRHAAPPGDSARRLLQRRAALEHGTRLSASRAPTPVKVLRPRARGLSERHSMASAGARGADQVDRLRTAPAGAPGGGCRCAGGGLDNRPAVQVVRGLSIEHRGRGNRPDDRAGAHRRTRAGGGARPVRSAACESSSRCTGASPDGCRCPANGGVSSTLPGFGRGALWTTCQRYGSHAS